MAEMILPGTYVEVRDEGLISAGRISTGNIGIVGTAYKGTELVPELIGSLSEAREKFGAATDRATLVRSLQLIYQNGGKTVYAVCTGSCSEYILKTTIQKYGKEEAVAGITLQAQQPGNSGNSLTVKVANGSAEATRVVEIKQGSITEPYTVSSLADLATVIAKKSKLVRVAQLHADVKNSLPNVVMAATFAGGTEPDYEKALAALEKDIINIVVLAGQDTGDGSALTALQGHLTQMAGIKRERIGVMGLGFAQGKTGPVPEDVPTSDRLILVTPGVVLKGSAGSPDVSLSSGYLAAAVAGVIASLPVHTSPTNKTLAIDGLTDSFNSGM